MAQTSQFFSHHKICSLQDNTGIILTGTINQFTSLQHNPQVLQLAGEEIANCQLFVVWPSGSKFALGLRNCLAKVV